MTYILRALDSGVALNLFVSGNAGTGKSFLISCIQSLLTSRSIPFLTCASTGIAADLIHGRTVHSAFSIFQLPNGDTVSSLDIAKPSGHAISLAPVIIIDEITMISRAVIDCLDHALRRLAAQAFSPGATLPFGGKHIILFGDLAQVPAVVRSRDDFTEAAQQFFSSLPYASFVRLSLSIVMRQLPGETTLLSLLTDLRSAPEHLSPASVAALRSRFHPGSLEEVLPFVDDFVGRDAPDGLVVTFTNAQAALYNALILTRRATANRLATTSFDAFFFVSNGDAYRAQPGHPDALHNPNTPLHVTLASDAERRLLFSAFRRRQFNTIIPFNLSLCSGARVMLLQNLDIASGLINGSRGTYIGYLGQHDALEVPFDNQPLDRPPTLITRTRSVSYPLADGREIFVFQFPLKLSWAVTAHKAQGQSLHKVAIDISQPAFAHGSLYVAISRVRTLDSLLLFGLPEFPEDGPAYHVNRYIQFHDVEPTLTDAYDPTPDD